MRIKTNVQQLENKIIEMLGFFVFVVSILEFCLVGFVGKPRPDSGSPTTTGRFLPLSWQSQTEPRRCLRDSRSLPETHSLSDPRASPCSQVVSHPIDATILEDLNQSKLTPKHLF